MFGGQRQGFRIALPGRSELWGGGRGFGARGRKAEHPAAAPPGKSLAPKMESTGSGALAAEHEGAAGEEGEQGGGGLGHDVVVDDEGEATEEGGGTVVIVGVAANIEGVVRQRSGKGGEPGDVIGCVRGHDGIEVDAQVILVRADVIAVDLDADDVHAIVEGDGSGEVVIGVVELRVEGVAGHVEPLFGGGVGELGDGVGTGGAAAGDLDHGAAVAIRVEGDGECSLC